MLKGGYQILNLEGIAFTSGISQTVRNAYEAIEGTRKAILVSGLEVDGVEYRDTFVDFTVKSGNFVGVVNGIRITIGNAGDGNDPITITPDTVTFAVVGDSSKVSYTVPFGSTWRDVVNDGMLNVNAHDMYKSRIENMVSSGKPAVFATYKTNSSDCYLTNSDEDVCYADTVVSAGNYMWTIA